MHLQKFNLHKIARVFREIGRADDLGSGVRNIFKYTPIYSKGGESQLIEGDIFKIIPFVPEGSEKSSEKIIALISHNKNITAAEMARKLKISPRAVEKQISKLKKQGKIKKIWQG